MKNLKIKIASFLMILTWGVQAQQESLYTQYMYNINAFNPAYVGSREGVTFFGMYRNQWLNQVGSPKVGLASVHTAVTDKIGLGATLSNEKEGPTNMNSLNVQFSYNVKLNQKYKLFFGLNGGVGKYELNLSELNIYNQNDETFNQDANKLTTRFGGGLFLMSENEYLGLSVPNLMKSNVYSSNNVIFQSQIHAYIIAGKVFNISSDWKFKPSVLAKITSGAEPQYDLSANFLFKEKLNLGAIYRWDNAYGFLAGYQINNQFFVGYSIDILTSKLNQYSSGSHEVFVRYELFKRYSKIQSPRFF
jgi:type IX secretion system PorP/SprF family membrane protein